MKIAVLDQKELFPIAFTMEATHDGPVPSVSLGWSDTWPLGMTQVTFARFPLLISESTCVYCSTTSFFQSDPVQLV